MRELDHPNIIKLHEIYESEYSFYYILEYMEGGSLYDIINTK